MSESTKNGVKRRDFLKVLGVSSAAGAAACSEPTGKLIPYLVSPDQTVPGVSTYYATTCRECAASCGVIAETRDGRVTKLEGNPEHPLNRGALCARGQSAVQGLYNPDRFRTPMIKTGGAWKAATWEEAINLLAQRLGEARGRGASNAVFLNQHESGSFPAFIDAWLAGFGMPRHVSVDFEADHAAIEAHRRAYGTAWPRFRFADAGLIISFGADFLDGWGASVPHQLDFADARAKVAAAPRFIYVGPRRSLTGLNADQWVACRPGGELAVAQFLQGRGDAATAEQASGVPAATLQRLQQEYAGSRNTLVIAGGRGENGLELATAAAALNQVRGGDALPAFEGVARQNEVLAAVERMRGGQVTVAFVRGANPAYALPKSAKFAEAFGKVGFKVSFSMYPDETTEMCDLILPDLHSLESWGDAEPVRGTVSLQQPAMDPVFGHDARSAADVMIAVAKKDAAMATRYPQADYGVWLRSRLPGGGNTQTLSAALAKGITAGSIAARPASTTAVPPVPATTAATTGDFHLITYFSPTLGDGRGANKPWLQELPDPVSKVLWSSWVEIHPETAGRLGIKRGDIVEITTGAGKISVPAWIYLGVRTDTVAVALGQGHASASQAGWFDGRDTAVQWGYGRYSRGVGANALDLLPARLNSGGALIGATRCSIARTGENETLVSPEGSARQHGRGIARAVNVNEIGQEDHEAHHGDIPGAKKQEFLPGLRSPVAADAQGELGSPTARDQGTLRGLYDPSHPAGMTARRWAMTIDLARCTGCAACVTACYAENNIPTVGAPWQNGVVYAVKKPGFNITRGREMNWLRLERYFEGADDGHFTEDFEARFVPMLCQHCGNAPCVPVCPVYATYHAPDGLNVQV